MTLWRRLRPHLPIVGLYALLALVLTWPLVRHLGTSYPTPNAWYGGDPNMYVWLIDWVAKGLTGHLPVEAGRMVFWPHGINVWAGYDGPLMLVFTTPLVLLLRNPILTYNLFILTCFVFAAVTAYALCWHLTRSRYAAGFGGFIFGFSTYLLIRALQHPNLMMLGTVPLLALAALIFFDAPSWRGAVWLAGAVLLNALSSWYYLIGGLLFLLLLGLFNLKRALEPKNWKPVLLAVGLSGLASSLPAWPMILGGSVGGNAQDYSIVDLLGAHPLNLILPHPFTNIFGGLTFDTYTTFPTGQLFYYETTSFIGLTVLLLVGWLIWSGREAKAERTGFWLATAGIFFVLAMGVKLKLEGLTLPLPFGLLFKFFPFSLLRSPNRLFVYALLATTVLAAYALRHLVAAVRDGRRLWLLTVLIAIGLLAERLIFPYPLFANQTPDFYRQIATDRETYALAELPILYPGNSEYNFYQITHGKPIVNGEYFYPAYSYGVWQQIDYVPLLRASGCWSHEPAEAYAGDRERSFALLREANVRYVIIHPLLMNNLPTCQFSRKYLRDFFDGLPYAYTDGDIIVYRVPE